MKQYETFELAFSGAALQDNWAQIDLMAEFTRGKSLRKRSAAKPDCRYRDGTIWRC